jgi:crossover junction endodeoxyribonuclease RuvC
LRILGIDPGSRITGFGLVELKGRDLIHLSHGVILLDVDASFPDRMVELGGAMSELMSKYKPDHVVIEKIFLGRNADSAFKLGHARGVCMYESRKHGAAVYEYATRLVKKGVTGSGSATKEQVQLMIQRLLKIQTIVRMDASDALAMAYYHSQSLHVTAKMSKVAEL